MDPPLQKKTSASSLRRVQSESGFPTSTTPSDQKPREVKSAPYKHPGIRPSLPTRAASWIGTKMVLGQNVKSFVKNYLKETRPFQKLHGFPSISESTCRRINGRNESKIIDKIARLIVPSAEDLADFGSEHLEHLIESINEGWNSSLPVTGTRPQPDYAVGFGQSAFTKDQLHKLELLTGNAIVGARSLATGAC